MMDVSNPWQMLHLALNIDAAAIEAAQKEANRMYSKTRAGSDSAEDALNFAGEVLARCVHDVVKQVT